MVSSYTLEDGSATFSATCPGLAETLDSILYIDQDEIQVEDVSHDGLKNGRSYLGFFHGLRGKPVLLYDNDGVWVNGRGKGFRDCGSVSKRGIFSFYTEKLERGVEELED